MSRLLLHFSSSPMANGDDSPSSADPSQQSQYENSERYMVGFIIANIVKTIFTSMLHFMVEVINSYMLSQVLMATISLRRTKEKSLIGLPPKTVGTCYVELSPEERQLNDHMEGEAKGLVMLTFLLKFKRNNLSLLLS
ncbi:hypothetical protein BRARA_J02709 [Brassica rapa]|uniref:Uncharacterized protein n=1 Tax=Brassica campestris TaxID=3711 RepID=A0A397XNV7_BRACM|nr:hypothetical protein BRARA_J02709 [Brassica rapa]